MRNSSASIRSLTIAMLVLTLGSSACHSDDSTDDSVHADSPATQPATDQPTITGAQTFTDRAAGFSLQYPADWRKTEDKEYVLAIEPAGIKPTDPRRRITVDVPSLPPHLPGMITLGRVKSGFIKGQKKKLTDVNVIEDVDQPVPGAKASRVVLTGKLDGRDRKMAALLMMRDDRVYIIRADSDLANYPQTKAAWDQMVASLRWVK